MSPVLKVVKTKFSRSSLEKKVSLPIVLEEEDIKERLVSQIATRVSNTESSPLLLTSLSLSVSSHTLSLPWIKQAAFSKD